MDFNTIKNEFRKYRYMKKVNKNHAAKYHQKMAQKVQSLYRLTDEQMATITERIISTMSKDFVPSENPVAIVVGGQSGSGKTALINYSTQLSTKREFIQIDNDFFRSFHPQEAQIKAKHPDYYVTATDQLSLGVTSAVIDYFRNHKYDIILHQTLKNNRVVDDAISKFIDAGYTVGVRALAVPYLESKMSQIERCESQLRSLGFCRHVEKENHDIAYTGVPKTIGYIEASGKYDFVEIYKRGNLHDVPQLVYAKMNPKTKTRTKQTLAGCKNVALDDVLNGFGSAEDALEKTREDEAVRCAATLPARISLAERNPANNFTMQLHINELKDRFAEYQATHQVTTEIMQ